MANFWAKLGIRKADEMERAIQLKAIRLAWGYTSAFLVVWSLYESYEARRTHTPVDLIPCFLLVSQNLVLILAQGVFTKKMAADGEKGGSTGLGRWLLLVALAALAIAGAGSLLLLAR